MPKKTDKIKIKIKIKIEKEKLQPRPRAPILPSKPFEDKRRRSDRRAKHKKDPRNLPDE